MPTGEWVKLALQAGVPLVLVAWLLYHLFSVLIPKASEDFQKALTLQQEQFMAQLREQRTELLAVWREDREMHREQLSAITHGLQTIGEVMVRQEKVLDDIADRVGVKPEDK